MESRNNSGEVQDLWGWCKTVSRALWGYTVGEKVAETLRELQRQNGPVYRGCFQADTDIRKQKCNQGNQKLDCRTFLFKAVTCCSRGQFSPVFTKHFVMNN